MALTIDSVVERELVPHATERKWRNKQTVVIIPNPEMHERHTENVFRMCVVAAQEMTKFVARGEGVVVLSLDGLDIYRSNYGDKLSTKRCLLCGDEVGRVVDTRVIGDARRDTPLFLYICDKHPKL